jgi:hypothetical protein
MTWRIWLAMGMACLGAAPPVSAGPDLRKPRPAGALIVYPDDRRTNIFYYGPGEIALAADADGRPQLSFLEARYTGTAAAGDKGASMFRSLLTLTVKQTGVEPWALASVRRAAGIGTAAELRPLPIQRLEAQLAYTPLRPADVAVAATPPPSAPPSAPPADDATPLPDGHFESSDDAGASAHWTRRTYVLALGPDEAQLFGDSLRRGRLVLSLTYSFVAMGAGEKAGAPTSEARVRTGATSIAVDAARWPALLRRVDVNESLPPGYAALHVYCYDFNNALRSDLYEKQVEIEAEGIGGGKVALATVFASAQPDLYARSVRFPVAVRFDRPYRFRVTETALDGTTRAEAWRAVGSWDHILDVTTPPERQTARPPQEEQP